MLDTTHNAAASLPQHPPDHRGCGRFPGWAVVQTHPQAERWACANLNRAGYQTYLPTYAARRRDPVTPTLHHTIERPLFPSYAFLAMDEGDPWVPARYAPGVRSLLMADGKPQMARHGAVEALQASDAARRSLPPPNSQWRPGSVVRVASGIMAGHPGIVLEIGRRRELGQREDMALVSLMFLGHLREISLPLDCLTSRDD